MTDEQFFELASPLVDQDVIDANPILAQKQERLFVHVSSFANDPNYVKCPRCWQYTHSGLFNFDNLCDKCCDAMIEGWPDHELTQEILNNRRQQLAFWKTRK